MTTAAWSPGYPFPPLPTDSTGRGRRRCGRPPKESRAPWVTTGSDRQATTAARELESPPNTARELCHERRSPPVAARMRAAAALVGGGAGVPRQAAAHDHPVPARRADGSDGTPGGRSPEQEP